MLPLLTFQFFIPFIHALPIYILIHFPYVTFLYNFSFSLIYLLLPATFSKYFFFSSCLHYAILLPLNKKKMESSGGRYLPGNRRRSLRRRLPWVRASWPWLPFPCAHHFPLRCAINRSLPYFTDRTGNGDLNLNKKEYSSALNLLRKKAQNSTIFVALESSWRILRHEID